MIAHHPYFGRVYRYGAHFAFKGGNGWYVGHDNKSPSDGPYRTMAEAKARAAEAQLAA